MQNINKTHSAGVQFWSTDYIITELGASRAIVMPLFIFTSITAPVGGVLFGGWAIDRAGEKGQHEYTSLLPLPLT